MMPEYLAAPGAGRGGAPGARVLLVAVMVAALLVPLTLAARANWGGLDIQARGTTAAPLVLPRASWHSHVIFVATEDPGYASEVDCELHSSTSGFLGVALTDSYVVDGLRYHSVASLVRTWKAGDTVTCRTPDGVARPALVARVGAHDGVKLVGMALLVALLVWFACIALLVRAGRRS